MSKQTTKDMVQKILTKHHHYDNGLGHMAIIKVDEAIDLIDKLYNKKFKRALGKKKGNGVYKEWYEEGYNDCHDNAKKEWVK